MINSNWHEGRYFYILVLFGSDLKRWFLSLPSVCGRAKLLRTEIGITQMEVIYRFCSDLLNYCFSLLLGVLEVIWTNNFDKFFDELVDRFFWEFFWRIFWWIFLTNFFDWPFDKGEQESCAFGDKISNLMRDFCNCTCFGSFNYISYFYL